MNAEGDKPSEGGEFYGDRDCVGKGDAILNQMVSRKDQQHGVIAMVGLDCMGGGGNGGRSIATHRFEQILEFDGAREPGGGVFIPGEEIVVAVGDSEYRAIAHGGGTQNGLLQQTFSVCQADKGLGKRLPRHGPQPGAGATERMTEMSMRSPGSQMVYGSRGLAKF